MGRRQRARRRRHAQLRLVVHRRGGADRHRRPLHDAGIGRGGRRQRLGRASSPCCASRGRAGRSTACCSPSTSRTCCSRRRPSARSTPPSCARACRSCRRKLGVRAAGLRAGHQGRPDRRLQRELRRARQGGARPGLGLHASRTTPTQQPTTPLADFGSEFAALEKRLRDRLIEPHAGRARRAQARRDLRLPAAVRRAAAACSAASSSRCSAAAARSRSGRCCAASTSPAAPRKARRSTACWARWRAPSASSAALPPPAAARGKSFFLHRLLKDVVFAEQGLVGENRAGRSAAARAARRSASPRCCC